MSASEIDQSLPWTQRTRVSTGNFTGKFGDYIGNGPNEIDIPDHRLLALDKHYPVAGKTILEPGCMEGQVTVGLKLLGAEQVDASDIRPVNCQLCKHRLRAYDFPTTWIPSLDVYTLGDAVLGSYDLVMNCGLLYHLEDPVSAMMELSSFGDLMFVDTHVAISGTQYCQDRLHSKSPCVEVFRGIGLAGKWYRETPDTDTWGGIGLRSFWMTEESLWNLLWSCGFRRIAVVQRSEDIQRLCVLASKRNF